MMTATAGRLRQPLIHVPIPGIVPYTTAGRLQETIVRRLLASKQSDCASPPAPHVITAEFQPAYTCGRRELGTISSQKQDFLRAGGRADFFEAMRGGQTTFHGPGQLVAYPIIDLRAHKLTPRMYVCLLERCLIATCAQYNIKASTSKHTGVWTSPDDKIGAVGVHMRRNITSHGIGLNVSTDLWWFDRIVACGLEGKRTTSFAKEGVEGVNVATVGMEFVRNFAERLSNVNGIDLIGQEELNQMLE